MNRRHFLKRLGRPFRGIRYLFSWSNRLRLYYRLFKDPRTPWYAKAVLVLAFLYLLSPVDLLPDILLPGVAHADDLVVALLALRLFEALCPEELVEEHRNALSRGRWAPLGG